MMTIEQNNYQIVQNKFNEVFVFKGNTKIAHFKFSKTQSKDELLEILNYVIFYESKGE